MEESHLKNRIFSISVVSPVFSEEDTLNFLVNYFHQNLNDKISEIIFVYHPKSNEKCINILKDLERNFSKVKIVKEEVVQKSGNGIAYRQGFKRAKGTHILMIDSDGEMDVGTVPKMIKKMEETDCDIVIGSRYTKGGGFVGYTFRKFLLNVTFQYIFRLLFFTKIKDLTCGFKLFKRHVIDKYKWTTHNQAIGAETTLRPLKGGDIIEEVPTVWKITKGAKHPLSFVGNLIYPILALKILFNF